MQTMLIFLQVWIVADLYMNHLINIDLCNLGDLAIWINNIAANTDLMGVPNTLT